MNDPKKGDARCPRGRPGFVCDPSVIKTRRRGLGSSTTRKYPHVPVSDVMIDSSTPSRPRKTVVEKSPSWDVGSESLADACEEIMTHHRNPTSSPGSKFINWVSTGSTRLANWGLHPLNLSLGHIVNLLSSKRRPRPPQYPPRLT